MTETAQLTLADFLLARIAEDEEALETARRMGVPPIGLGSRIWSGIGNHPTVSEARLAAECEAKRRIVELHEKNRERVEANAREHTMASNRGDLTALPTLRSAGWDLGGRDWALEIVLRQLALPYADHPDFREEWRA